MRKKKLLIMLIPIALLTLLVSCNIPSRQPDPVDPPQPPDEVALLEPSEDIILGTPFPEDAERDPCLEGAWNMDASYLDILVQNLVPVPNIYVPRGSLTFYFYSDGLFNYSGDLTIQINFAENWYMQGVGGFSDDGAYATEGDIILFDLQGKTTEVYKWFAYKDGQSAEQPGGGPEISLTPPGRAPYRCTADTLEIDTMNPTRDTITMFFFR